MTTFSVIINTYNRRDQLARLLRMVLALPSSDFEVIVADDGSTDGTSDLVTAMDDPRLRYVHQENAGLGAARNLGASAAEGDYLVWLDDDDEVRSDWLSAFEQGVSDDDPAVVCIGARIVDPDGNVLETRLPVDMGPAFDHHVGLMLPGSFAVRRDAFDAVDGFTPGLRCSHQTELALRLLPRCTTEGWKVAHVDIPALTMNRDAPEARGRNEPAKLLRCTSWILEQHRERLALDPTLLASYYGIAGVCAARLGRHKESRVCFAHAVRVRPTNPKMAARWLIAAVPPLSKWIWPAQRSHKASGGSP